MKKQHIKIFYLGLAIGILLASFSGFAVTASELDGNPRVWLNSNFLLWNENEKIIDSNFTIIMSLKNESINHTGYYEITIDGLDRNGTFQYFETVTFDILNASTIDHIRVRVNNETALEAFNVLILKGVTQSDIRPPSDPWAITLSPWEWTAKEWNIFFGVISAALVGSLVGYRLVKRYRKYSGFKVIE